MRDPALLDDRTETVRHRPGGRCPWWWLKLDQQKRDAGPRWPAEER